MRSDQHLNNTTTTASRTDSGSLDLASDSLDLVSDSLDLASNSLVSASVPPPVPTSPKASLVSALAPASDSGPSDSNTDDIPVPSSIVTPEAAHVSGISDIDTDLTPAPARSPSQTPVPALVLVIGSSSPVPAPAKAPPEIILLDSSPPALRTEGQAAPSTREAIPSLLLAPMSFGDAYEAAEPIASGSSSTNVQSDSQGIRRTLSSTSSASGKAPKRKIQVAANSKPRATRVTARQVLIPILLTVLPYMYVRQVPVSRRLEAGESYRRRKQIQEILEEHWRWKEGTSHTFLLQPDPNLINVQ
jgi:hypothetical protein